MEDIGLHLVCAYSTITGGTRALSSGTWRNPRYDMSLFKNRTNSVTPFKIFQNKSTEMQFVTSCIFPAISLFSARTASMITYGLNCVGQDISQR